MKRWIALLLAGLLVFGLAGCQSSQMEEASAEPEETETPAEEAAQTMETTDVFVGTATSGEMEMDYIKFGSGEKTFVILPGLSVHSLMGLSDAIAAAFQDFVDSGYTVYLFDRTKSVTEGYTVRDMADDTAAAMKELGIESADVFGASQGGMIAQYLAIDHPELVHKLVLGSTLSKPNDTARQVIQGWIDLAEARDEEGLLAGFVDAVYSEGTLSAYRDTLISSNRGITEEEYERFVILASACLTFDSSAELSSITCPVLVLGAEGDRVLTADASREIAEALSCEIYVYDENYGHAVYDEATDYHQKELDFFAE